MIKDYSKEKLYNAITYFKQNTNNCNKTKLFKLLFYLDMLHFKETGSSVTGLDYYAWEHGPVPYELYKKMNDENDDLRKFFNIERVYDGKYDPYIITPLKEFDDTYFSKREMRLLKEVADAFRCDTATSMVDLTHRLGEPWQKTLKTKGKDELIDYFLVLDEENSYFKKEDIIERQKDRERLFEIFS